jgi:GntR family transcriptional regulator
VETKLGNTLRAETMTLDRASPIPLYVQISERLRRSVSEGAIDPKDLSDARLAKQFGVSRMTVRQALDQLRKQGLLEREQGRGTRVVSPLEGQLSKMERFFDEWSLQGARVSTRLLKRGLAPADRHLAGVLNVAERVPLGIFRRIRYVNDLPICFDVRYLRAELLHQLHDEDLLRATDLVLQENLRTVFTKADIRISATVARKREAKALEIDVGTPLLKRFMDLYSIDGRGILCGPSYFRADLYTYRVTVTS